MTLEPNNLEEYESFHVVAMIQTDSLWEALAHFSNFRDEEGTWKPPYRRRFRDSCAYEARVGNTWWLLGRNYD
jgi:hypothetical protein